MKTVMGLFLLLWAAVATAQGFGSGDVARGDARRAQLASIVTVVAILPADVHTLARNEDKAVGAALGSAAGLLAAHRSRNGIVQAASAIAGGAIGVKVAERLGSDSTPAVDVVVRTSDGSIRVVTQQDADGLSEGAQALLLQDRDWNWDRPQTTRVRALPATARKE